MNPYDSMGPPRDPLSKFVLPAVVVLILLLIGGGYLLFFQGIASQTQTTEEAQLSPTPLPVREYMMMGGGTQAPTPTEVIIEVSPTQILELPTDTPPVEQIPSPSI